MRKTIIYLTCLAVLTACEYAPYRLAELQQTTTLASEPSTSELNTISLIQRKKQQAVVESAFSRRTTPERARQLAAICYDKTLGTIFMPFDLAEIALAETGGHRLSAGAVSAKGARGVWQLMPRRARSHGYSARDMLEDDKCAEAAVRELYTKLEMAQGDLDRAKKLYCGQGPQANAYMKKIRTVRREMSAEFTVQNDKLALAETVSLIR